MGSKTRMGPINCSHKGAVFIKLLKQQGSVVASINMLIAAILVLGAAGWPYLQKAYHKYHQREANAFFEGIEAKEIKYKNINNKYLPFDLKGSAQALKKLRLNPDDAGYYDFSVQIVDRQTFRIIAQLKPRIVRKWYLHNPKAKFNLVYEKKEGEKGRRIE
jgi:hypothetical protein